MTKVLLLEDEESIRGFVRVILKRQGFDIVEAATGEEALRIAEQNPDLSLAVLDVMLPGISGFDVCRILREQNPRLGIIMLTAKSQERDKVEGLDCGADDYIAKPFGTAELLARVNALLRRVNLDGDSTGSHTIALAPFLLSVDKRTLYKQEEEVELTPKEFAIVKLLMEKANTAVSRDDIINMVWGRHYIGDLKTVDIHIRRLRQKLEEDPSHPQYIETIWGFGYMWRREGKHEGH
ncbi:response regulator transcription factor [Aneurinibacillus aneurinilyticus]|jgi:DNA-binding response OmpR family regulator|uniref:Response regulator transcription factor n=2 Tax=Aneurinibacillus aneurinilyticus TaxID=1391 RepID=A0A848CPQ5_ANEAE|nr:response regulator transcription factor [Aneurinibacillus aneurinilyticus]ERI05640.1 putative transcriptional regulatory protein OmpR [Aneurinibacillus aneurinilyticus ATCC 12856]MCI1696685.1 response regulator transcription factor [Aneurinibacillus aneurinilyticus]MED0672802.1 response regulator transcription factor [Aneurinibacillus aneurinilyticus]MED0706216.1 response regulator transcription factor [Aneurinibacillus aneurinilyticus]MED0724170.1 response regulator transcription factor [A